MSLCCVRAVARLARPSRWAPIAACGVAVTGHQLLCEESPPPTIPVSEYRSLEEAPISALCSLPVLVTQGNTNQHAHCSKFSNDHISGSIEMYQQNGRPEFAPRLWMRVAVTVNPELAAGDAHSEHSCNPQVSRRAHVSLVGSAHCACMSLHNVSLFAPLSLWVLALHMCHYARVSSDASVISLCVTQCFSLSVRLLGL